MLAASMASTGGVCGEDGKCARSASRSFACSVGALVSSLTAHDRRDAVVSWPCRMQVRSGLVLGDVYTARHRSTLTETKSRKSSSNISLIVGR